MQTKLIKNKIKSASNIKKITKTMEMVSVAKMKKAIEASQSSSAFVTESRSILNTLAREREESFLSKKNDSKKILMIIIAGQKGLCGGYNSSVYREVYKYINTNKLDSKNINFVTVGKYAEKIARKFGENIIASYIEKDFKNIDARNVVKMMVSEFSKETYSEVIVVYNNFINASSYKTEIAPLLPFRDVPTNENIDKEQAGSITFEPGVGAVYEKIINLVLQNIIIGYVARARAAEHSARMMAMKTASDNAGEMLGDLKLWYNKVRQSAITQEIAEISAGAMASGK